MAKQLMKNKAKQRKNVKKSFYEVMAPMTSTKIHLYGGSVDEMDGRIVKIDLTKNLKGKSLELKLRVRNNEGKLEADPIGVKLAGSYIRRVMGRGIEYVEESFECECRDFIIKVKPFLITRRKVSRAVRNQLRTNAKKLIEGHVKIRSLRELFTEIMSNKIQRLMASKLKKIYPLSMAEIRVLEIVRAKEENDEDLEEEIKVEEKVEEKEEKVKESKKIIKKKEDKVEKKKE